MFVFKRKNDIYSGKASGVRQFSLNKMIDASHPPNHHQRPNSSTTVHIIILIVFSFDELHAICNNLLKSQV